MRAGPIGAKMAPIPNWSGTFFMATIRDVAKESGVSISTVSNVLTGADRPVSAHVRQRVLSAARRMNYHPSAVAQALVLRRANAIAVMSGIFNATDIVTNAYAAGVMVGVLEEASRNEQNVILYPRAWKDAATSLAAIRDRRTDGIVLISPPLTSDSISAIASVNIPLITIAGPLSGHVPSVDVDDCRGIELVVEHLVRLGHRKIAHIHGNMDLASAPLRRAAFLDHMARFGLAARSEYIVGASYDGRGAAEAVRTLLALSDPPTAIVAGNDNIGAAVVEVALNMGVDVPGRLSVVGFDDVPIAALIKPKLTTVRQPLARIGALAAQLLLKKIDGQEVAETVYKLPPEFVVRETTAPPSTDLT